MNKETLGIRSRDESYEPPEGDQLFEPLMKSYKISVNNGVGKFVKRSTFRYSKCTGRKKAVIVSFVIF